MANWEAMGLAGLSSSSDDTKIDLMESLLSENTIEKLIFAVGVISEKSESWLVRAETCRFVRDIESDNWNEIGLCQAIINVLSDENEDLTLRQWAAFLVNKCQSNLELAELVSKLIIESEDIRWNIIDSLNDADEIAPSMEKALQDNVLSVSSDKEVKSAVSGLLT